MHLQVPGYWQGIVVEKVDNKCAVVFSISVLKQIITVRNIQ